MSNSLDPDHAQHFVGPDLGQNCLQMLSADDACIGNELHRIITVGRRHNGLKEFFYFD